MLPMVVSACINDPVELPVGTQTSDDGNFVLNFAVQVPDVQSAVTRTLSEEPDYSKLKLWCVVFQDNGHPSSNFLIQVEEATQNPKNEQIPQRDEYGRDLIPFSVTLESTTEDAIIHFIAINTEGWEDKETAQRENPLLNIEYGPENVIIPQLKTDGGRDAYWQRIVLGCPIMSKNKEKIDELVSMWSPVPLIRNFARITVEKRESVTNFYYTGFCLVNTLDSGTIAPYNEINGFPNFVEALPLERDAQGNSVRKYRPYDYDEITDGISKVDDSKIEGCPYIGIRPSGWKIKDKDATVLGFKEEYQYMYERPFTETDHTYVIVRGIYYPGSSNTDEDTEPRETFYKIDIGEHDARGLFTFSNFLRNFNYRIVITNVEGFGYNSITEAAVGNIYNNNISAAVETQHLLNVSDGHEMMYVNFTSYVVVTDKEPIRLRYRYFELEDNSLQNDTQIFTKMSGNTVTEGVVWNDPEVGCVSVPGGVISSARYAGIVPDDIQQGDKTIPRQWEEIEIQPNEPSAELKVQQVVLYKPNGLSRRITLYLQKPWSFEGPVYTYPGQHDHREADKATGKLKPGVVSDQVGKPLTIFFKLPIGLPKAMFPLKFVIESNRQNIENDKNGTIVVQSGTSLFKDEPENITDIRIQYIKTVTWSEYDPENKGDADSTTDNYDSKGNYIGNIVRCRFLTITDLSDTGDDQNPVTTVLIDNPYFVRGRTTFTRSREVGDVDDDSTDNN